MPKYFQTSSTWMRLALDVLDKCGIQPWSGIQPEQTWGCEWELEKDLIGINNKAIEAIDMIYLVKYTVLSISADAGMMVRWWVSHPSISLFLSWCEVWTLPSNDLEPLGPKTWGLQLGPASTSKKVCFLGRFPMMNLCADQESCGFGRVSIVEEHAGNSPWVGDQ